MYHQISWLQNQCHNLLFQDWSWRQLSALARPKFFSVLHGCWIVTWPLCWISYYGDPLWLLTFINLVHSTFLIGIERNLEMPKKHVEQGLADSKHSVNVSDYHLQNGCANYPPWSTVWKLSVTHVHDLPQHRLSVHYSWFSHQAMLWAETSVAFSLLPANTGFVLFQLGQGTGEQRGRAQPPWHLLQGAAGSHPGEGKAQSWFPSGRSQRHMTRAPPPPWWGKNSRLLLAYLTQVTLWTCPSSASAGAPQSQPFNKLQSQT